MRLEKVVFSQTRKGARVAEEARLESVYSPKGNRGFESPSFRLGNRGFESPSFRFSSYEGYE